ncbi:MAG: transcriptional regulator, partial [Planctomycetes bacterium]|nr:transcriptional regulator [Planctomycetota bacterium]
MQAATGNRRRPVGIALVLGLCILLASPLPATAGDSARDWLERMAQATRALNYDGTFVYHNDDWMQSMRIIHRADENGTRERLVALTGEPREVIRDRTTVTCILPDDRSVVVGKSRMAAGTGAPAFDIGAGFVDHYHLSTQPGERVAGRDTQVVDVRPRDPYRYG